MGGAGGRGRRERQVGGAGWWEEQVRERERGALGGSREGAEKGKGEGGHV